MQVHINGNAAWVVGRETFEAKLKDGTSAAGANFVTNVFEKIDGRWLMVSHHAHNVPK
jgi:ketosteroid isomerase-like protein